MQIVEFFTPEGYGYSFYPFSELREAQDLLWGGRTLGEQWIERLMQTPQKEDAPYRINPLWIPSESSAKAASALGIGQGLLHQGIPLAERPSNHVATVWTEITSPPDCLNNPTDLFLRCGEAMDADWNLAAAKWGAVVREDWPNHVVILGHSDSLLVHPSVKAHACTFNTESGPILLGEGVEIQEGSHLRGPLMIGLHTQVKMACRISGPSAIGRHCRLGGELSNVVIHDYSNKGHDGFLGNSVLGSWCNLGAGTNSSNLKSNYSRIRLWNQRDGQFIETELQFCGLLMGDHSKCGISFMFNTGTTVGTGAQLFGSGFPPKHIPSFSWGGSGGFELHGLDQFLKTAEAVMARRDVSLSDSLRNRMIQLHGNYNR